MGEGAIDVLWGRAAFQRDLERPKEWHNRNLVKFNKDKCKIPHRSRKNSARIQAEERVWGKGHGGPGRQHTQHEPAKQQSPPTALLGVMTGAQLAAGGER